MLMRRCDGRDESPPPSYEFELPPSAAIGGGSSKNAGSRVREATRKFCEIVERMTKLLQRVSAILQFLSKF
jgi:hypothetical protein